MLTRYAIAFALRYPIYSVLACTLVVNLLLWQSASAHNVQQGQAASFTLSEARGKCTSVTGYGAHFPPGSAVIVAGPQVNGRDVGDFVQINKQVAEDGTFTVTLNPCPQQMVTPAGTFPISDGLQFTFTADTQAQNGVGAAATYTVSGLGNPGLPNTGIAAEQPPMLAIVLFVGGALAALGGYLLASGRVGHREP